MASATPIGDKSVLFVMAAEAEYGPHLRNLFTPLMTGVGPVEAAVRLSAELAALKAEGALPDLIVSLGSAGSRKLEQAEIYQAVSVSYRDMDASPLGFEKGATPFLDLPVTVPLPFVIPGIKSAALSTGGAIISGAAYDALDADMVDMETFACLRACQLFGVPLIGLRGISDGAADLRHVNDWTEYLHVIDEKLAAAIGLLEQAIESGAIRLA
ncbi:MAG: 5'-methylthioadenosine/S-adenosylhomocysteine nucleosidase [Mesorhizobium sp.]|uniref:5'-methylthioadenosine/S-adenosylhomocysteine nucleosidase n=1 Tax=Mesorhizobium sp. TaxID=1871066 RepID=UPI000FE968BA|nr:5'-methylthioadenosine/S-adenosylhomocysteine nucleosidase [Mesorhizobium sp.]RWL84156.1 MAG: 5'-methylthioadenosine/S-adenosylhomocysteine nucleosidase [Mesorhizobium sp.]RWL88635.1 MAG: 5'-methylthioadenosine/S-adenosylhomocysteine nucleosidase [Mesorhizobium sp.]RWM03491.1 MAG: 5'-methylthioadenosine/S-adenosylhomocysteine nucleosidase [Mesorhizobium sp.]